MKVNYLQLLQYLKSKSLFKNVKIWNLVTLND